MSPDLAGGRALRLLAFAGNQRDHHLARARGPRINGHRLAGEADARLALGLVEQGTHVHLQRRLPPCRRAHEHRRQYRPPATHATSCLPATEP
jgi:hypothetical protein